MEIIPQSLSSVFSDNYFSIHLALVLNNKIRVFEERSQTKIPICEQSHSQTILWGKLCIFFLCVPMLSFCQVLAVSHYKFLVSLEIYHFPRKLILQGGQSTQYFTNTPQTYLTPYLNGNHFCNLQHLPFISPSIQISPILQGPTQVPPLLCISFWSHQILQKCCRPVTFTQMLCLLSSNRIACPGRMT